MKNLRDAFADIDVTSISLALFKIFCLIGLTVSFIKDDYVQAIFWLLFYKIHDNQSIDIIINNKSDNNDKGAV